MHHIRRRFQRSSKPSKDLNEPSPFQEYPPYQWRSDEVFIIPDSFNVRLPTELLMLIGTYVERKRDLSRLCMASKEFRIVFAPFLFRVIEIKGPSGPKSTVMQLAAALPTSSLSQLVEELYVHLEPDRHCAKRIESRLEPESLHPNQLTCECRGYDEALGQLLASLHNIKILEIRCRLCTGTHSHDYIHRVEMPYLTSFTFRCLCSEALPRPSTSILLAPYMVHVEALSVACSNDRWYGAPPGNVAQLARAVPKLRTLCHNGGTIHNELLATSRVDRLLLDDYQGCNKLRGQGVPLLHENICRSPGVLSHLSMVDILTWLPPAMNEKMQPYRHLRFIGTIEFPGSEESSALAALRFLAPLKALKSLAIHQTKTNKSGDILSVFNPSPEFFLLLGQHLPSLQRVFLLLLPIQAPPPLKPALWEKLEIWEQRLIPRLEPWDLVSGKVDAF